MVILGIILNSVRYDGILRRYGRKMPFLVPNNEHMGVDDPKIEDAKRTDFKDMLDNVEYIHPELLEHGE